MKWLLVVCLLCSPVLCFAETQGKEYVFRKVADNGVRVALRKTNHNRTFFWYVGDVKYTVVMAKDCKSLLMNTRDFESPVPMFISNDGDVDVAGKTYADGTIINRMYKETSALVCR